MCCVGDTFVAIANVGDSRAVLGSWRSDGGISATALSEDHKPTIPSERIRIETAGGFVREVEGASSLEVGAPGTELWLRMSRSFGDFYLKQVEDFPPDSQPVIAVPDVVIVPRTEQQAFLILACDGVWDVMTNQETVDLIAKQLYEEKRSPAESCDALLTECLRRGSNDNMSVMVIKLTHTISRPANDGADTPLHLLSVSSISSVLRSNDDKFESLDPQTDTVDSCRKRLEFE